MSSLQKGITLVIDGSQMGNDNAALMISLLWKNRSIPICWTVKSGGKGHFKTVDHLKVVKKTTVRPACSSTSSSDFEKSKRLINFVYDECKLSCSHHMYQISINLLVRFSKIVIYLFPISRLV